MIEIGWHHSGSSEMISGLIGSRHDDLDDFQRDHQSITNHEKKRLRFSYTYAWNRITAAKMAMSDSTAAIPELFGLSHAALPIWRLTPS